VNEVLARDEVAIQTFEQRRRRSAGRLSTAADCRPPRPCRWSSSAVGDARPGVMSGCHGRPSGQADVEGSCFPGTDLRTACRTRSRSANRSADIRESASAERLAEQRIVSFVCHLDV